MKKAHLVALAASLALALSTLPLAAQETQRRAWLDKSLAVEKRVDLLLAQITADEKVALLQGPMAVAFVPGMKMPEGAIGSAGYVPAVDPRLLARFDEAGQQRRIAKGTYNLGIGTDAGTMVLTGTANLPASTLKP